MGKKKEVEVKTSTELYTKIQLVIDELESTFFHKFSPVFIMVSTTRDMDKSVLINMTQLMTDCSQYVTDFPIQILWIYGKILELYSLALVI